MKILALECSAKCCSAAISENENVLAYKMSDGGETHSVSLLPMAEEALTLSGVSLEEIDVFAVTAGPGSFTGVRIGVSAVKGLAFGKTEACCASVSSLRAAAENIRDFDGIICATMDARRSQVYTACFEWRNGELVRLTEDDALSIAELGRSLAELSCGRPVMICGDGYTVAYPVLSSVPELSVIDTPEELRLQNAAGTALAACSLASKGELVTPSALTPVYLRLPQAERERLEKEKLQSQKN